MSRRSLAEAARAVDGRSTRSKQRKVGASEIGVCRRRAGYSHHGTPYSDVENVSGVAAINGTWIHKGALDTMRRQWGTLIETRVENKILRGHVDGIDLPNDWRVKAGLEPLEDAPDVVEVDDLKTKRDGRLVAHVRNVGPKRSELFQAHLYAGMLRRGEVSKIKRFSYLADLGPLPVELIRLRYWSRAGEQDDGAQEYPYEQPFDPDIEAEAWEWVKQVAGSSKPEDLPRDQDGPGLSIVCDNCPFVTACWGEAGDRAPQSVLIVTDADLAQRFAEYDSARAAEREAKARKDLARAVLDATEPAIYTDGDALAFRLYWSGGKVGDVGKIDIDTLVQRFEQMQALYRDAGLPVPEVPYLEPQPSPRTIQLTRWDVPEVPCGKPVGDPHPFIVGEVIYLQDRPRGGWTAYERITTPEMGQPEDEWSEVPGEQIAELTAGTFAKEHTSYVDPRPRCVLKKAHSGDCWPEATIQTLDLGETPT